MSLTRRNRDRILAALATNVAGPAVEGGQPVEIVPATPAARQASLMQVKLVHDLRELKAIHSIEKKIELKRKLLPDYAAWIEGLLAGEPHQEDVLPTAMIWKIDTGAYRDALPLIDHVLENGIQLPARYDRAPATLIVEEIAIAADKVQQNGEAFDLDVLLHVEAATADFDMHDQVRAKLEKAIGVEMARAVEALDVAQDTFLPAADAALARFRRAHELHDRVGVKDRIKRLDKVVTAVRAAHGQAPADDD